MKYVGKKKYIDAIDMKEEYMRMGENDEIAAFMLEREELYNEAIYMYIQSMEKKIKSCICEKINVALPVFAQKIRDIGHSLDASIVFLIEILAGNDNILKQQLSHQLLEGVFENISFSQLHNDCRYPKYNFRKKEYSILEFDSMDCMRIKKINDRLNIFLKDLRKL